MHDDCEKLLRTWFEEVWNQGRADRIDALLAEDALTQGLVNPVSEADARPILRKFHAEFRRAFPDVHFTVEDVIADGPRVAARLLVTGTHRGDGVGIAPTGRTVEFRGAVFVTFKNGQIHRAWNLFDFAGMRGQLGA